MKKILSAVIFAPVIFSASFCSAYDYDSDQNYIFVTTGGGGSFY